MVLYHGFAAAALTDPTLRGADAFANAHVLLDALAAFLHDARDAGEVAAGVDPAIEARAILGLVLGLSLGVLLDPITLDEALAALDAHLDRLAPTRPNAPKLRQNSSPGDVNRRNFGG
jgi:hypothetical protein